MAGTIAGLSPTHITGLFAYTFSFLACAGRWLTQKKTDAGRRWFGVLTLVQLVLLLDMMFRWRWKVHALLVREAVAEGVYNERRDPQLWVLIALGVVLVVVSLWVIYRWRARRGLALAMTGTLILAVLWCTEAISYHAMDQVLYTVAAAGVRIVGLSWCVAALMVCVGCWIDAARR